MQDEVSRRIAEALKIELSPADEKRLARAQRPAGKAYELYMKGRASLFSERIEDVNRAIADFERARQEDPAFAPAWIGLGSAFARMGFTFDPDGDWLDKAEAMSEKALTIDPKLPEARYLKGLLAWTPKRGFDHATAIAEFMTAIAGRPSLTEGHERLGLVLLHVGMLEEASAQAHQALAINPVDAMAQTHLGLCRYLQGRYQEALEVTRAAEEERSSWGAYQLALCQLHVGDVSGAIESAEQGAMRFRGDPAEHSLRGLIAAHRGDAAAARNHIALTVANKRSFGHYHHTQYDVACIWAMIGEKEQALDWLTDAARNGFPCYNFFEIDSMLESVRAEARFTSLIEELKAECDGYRRLYRELLSASGRDSDAGQPAI